MARLLTVLSVLFAAVFALAPVASADSNTTTVQASKRPDGSFQLAQGWNDRVCCKRGNSDWWTTWRQCQRAGGYQTANRECRNDGGFGGIDLDLDFGFDQNRDSRICCKQGRRDWWSTWRECRRVGGRRVGNRECRDDSWWRDHRVCCQRGRHDFWTTQRNCYRHDGFETRNDYCRDDRDNHIPWDRDDWRDGDRDRDGDWDRDRDRDGDRDRGDDDDEYGNPDRRVCCKQGDRDWWTTARECRRADGEETANRECRND